jgi:RHS repeat-associated protein
LADGSIEFVDAKNVAHSRIPVGYMWDAAMTGEEDKKPVKFTVEQASPGKATLVIAPDAAWFMDPARAFPVTVDPTYVSGTTKAVFDTWVRSGVTTDQSASTDLQVGYDGSFWARSFLNFTTAQFAGKDILSANISLWQHSSLSCTPTSMSVRSSTPATTDSRWTDQPTLGTSYGAVSSAKGFSASCPGGRITVPMTALAQAWSTATYPTGGLALVATNEQDSGTYRKFYSTAGIADPFITLTWNRPPAVPAIPAYVSAAAYAPPNGASALYSPYLKPWVSTKASDADGNIVKYLFEFHTSPEGPTSLKATCTSAVYASGTTAGCQPNVNLPENTAIYVKAKANDGRRDSAWSGWSPIRIGSLQPVGPTVSCPSPYAINSWQDNEPTADVTCTITATGSGFNAPGYIRVTADGKPVATNFTGGAAGQIKITPSSDPAVAKTTVTFDKKTSGLHRITAQAESPAGRLSGSASYSFGWGGSGITSPTVSPRITTSDNIKIEASGPPKGQSSTVEAKVRWRVSGYGGSAYDTVGWNEDTTSLPLTDNGAGGVVVSTTWDTNNAQTDAHLDADPSTPAIEPTTLNKRVPVLLDVQVCFTYASSTQCTWSQKPGTTVQRVPHAFGNGFPTAEAGPGQVALWTGEFNTDSTDISVPGYTGDLTISRSHASYAGPGNTVNSVFGPGWVATFDGADAGAAGMEVVDSTRTDGTIALVDGDGSALVYESPTGQRRTTAGFATGTWVPADEDTVLDAAKLTVTGTGASTTLSYIEDDGTITTWTPAAAPTATTDTLFRAAGVAEPGVASKTTYSYDGTGRISRILAPAPPGVTCPATGTLNPGCRALRFVYTTINGQVRLSEAYLDIYNPDKTGGAGMDSIKVATYTYEAGGKVRLLKVTDPRSNLSTEYTYNDLDDLTTIKPAGQTPYQLNYVADEDDENLDTVTRARPSGDPAGGTSTLAKMIYSVPLSGTGLPDLSSSSVALWNQKVAPTNGFAVFGPDHELATAPGAGDWQYADLQYTDASGYTVNTTKYGAGDWQYTATDYNDQGSIVRSLDERALRQILDSQTTEEPVSGAMVDQLATLTVYNQDISNASAVVTPAGTLVTDTYGPARNAALKDGSVKWVRPHTHTDFDQLAPNNGINPDTTLPYRLATTETSWTQDPGDGTDLERMSQTITNYGDATGWAQSLPAKIATDVNLNGVIDDATDIVKTTLYDAEGRVIQTQQPNSNGADAGTTKTVYYTAAANTPFAECGGKPQWAGLVCKTYPAAGPTGPSGATPTLPTTTTTAYNYLLAPKTVVETSGAVTRTNTTTYLVDGRTASSKTVVAGVVGSTPNTEKITTYDLATGQPTVVTAKNADGTTAGTITTGYDTWGRQTTYQPSGEQVTTTVYDAAGRTKTVTDANGSTNYTYDGADAAGKTERRGLTTKVEVTTAGNTWTSTGAYDADSSMTVQKLPGGITQYNDFDNTGEPVGLRYTGQTTTLNDDGSTTVDVNGGWLSWSIDNDVTGRVAREWTPDGGAFTGPAGDAPGDAIPYDRAYAYDNAGRLTQVKDRTAATTGVDITDPTAAPCVTRTYGFDRNDNRLTKTTAKSAADGACPTTGGTTTTRTFDTADRHITGAGGNGNGNYTYDALGRGTSIPASDAPDPAAGNIALTYYDNDLAHSIAQDGTTTTFTLDALDRRSTETATDGTTSSQTVRHYTDTSDNPTWVTQGTTTQRYAELIGSDLGLTTTGTTGSLTLTNQHGDVVTTVDLNTPSSTATSISGWNNFDEFGNSTTETIATGPVDYGWLGGKQRAVTGAGLTLMGVRLYNPVTALFTSIDPVEGGNANAYTYPSDPVNSFDLDGKRRMYDDDERTDRQRARNKAYWSNPYKNYLQKKATNYNPGRGNWRKPLKASYKAPKKPKKVYKLRFNGRRWRSAYNAMIYGAGAGGAAGGFVGFHIGCARKRSGKGCAYGFGVGSAFGSIAGMYVGFAYGWKKWR